jgi:thioredoxin reductase
MNDLLIIGAGPTGLYAGFQAGLRQIKATIVDGLAMPGGLLTAFYPDKPIYDVPGFVSVRADAFIEAMLAQWRPYHQQVPLVLNEKVTAIKPIEGGYQVTSHLGQTYLARFVLIASGNSTLTPKTIPLADPQLQPHVHYAIHDLTQFKGKRIAVLGGGDSAFDWANTLLPLAQSVTLIHRRDSFRALNQSVITFKSKGHLIAPAVVADMTMTKSGIVLKLQQEADSQSLHVEVDDVVVCYGFVSLPSERRTWGMTMVPEGIVVNAYHETSLPNIFAVGNASTYQGKGNNLASSLGEVAAVMETIQHRLFPGKKIVYSSFLKI